MFIVIFNIMVSEEEIFEELEKKHKDVLIDPDNLETYHAMFSKEKKDLFDASKLADKRILVTGISGFVGSHIAEKLISLEQNIDIYGDLEGNPITEECE